MKTILATAYDINPYKGSESGTGWNFILQIARFNNVIAVTRKNNRMHIEKYILENGIDTTNIEFHYFDLPYFLMFWKKGSRGSFVYYNLWQLGLVLDIFFKRINFDICQHVNFHADHVPSFLWLFNKPFIWGPVNHNEPIPVQYLSSKSAIFKDRFRFLVKFVRWKFDPFLYLCSKYAFAVIGGNSSVQSRLNIPDRKFHKISTVGASVLSESICDSQSSCNGPKFTVMSVGRFVSIKSFDISLRAFNVFYCSLTEAERLLVRFLLVGSGPLDEELKRITNGLDCRDAVEFVSWIEQEKLFSLYRNASLMLAPSHEGAGAVLAEAQSFGLPVICFDNFGAGEIIDNRAGIVIKYSDYCESFSSMGEAVSTLFRDKNKYLKLREGSFKNYIDNLSWDSKGLKLKDIFELSTSGEN